MLHAELHEFYLPVRWRLGAHYGILEQPANADLSAPKIIERPLSDASESIWIVWNEMPIFKPSNFLRRALPGQILDLQQSTAAPLDHALTTCNRF